MSSETVDIKAWIDNRKLVPYQWLIMGLCFFIVLFDGFDVAVMGFIAPSLIQEWGLSKAAFGPVMSAGMIGLAIGALTAGPYADRIGRKKVLLTAVRILDIAVRHCYGHALGLTAELMLPGEVRVYCSTLRLFEVSDLVKATLLYTTSHANWPKWFAHAG